MSKGSGRRPAAISRAEADANWERTFGRVNAALNAVAADVMTSEVNRIVNERDDRRDHDRHPSIPL